MTPVVALLRADFDEPGFSRLIAEASERTGAALRATIDDELPRLSVVGVRAGGTVVGVAAFEACAARSVLKYIAVKPDARGAGHGTGLIHHIRALDPAKELHAETDDDAVGFYRRLGFAVSAVPRAELPHGRRRYRCILPPLSPPASAPPAEPPAAV